MSDRQAELAALRMAARAYVEWEAELSGQGIPLRTEVRVQPTVASPAERTPAPAQVADSVSRSQLPPAASAARSQPANPSELGADTERGIGVADRAPSALQGMQASAPQSGGPRGPGSVAPPGDKRARLALLAEEARGCTRCGLAQGRTQSVFSRGDPDARLMFVGEGPGFEEDRSGQPFVGPAGKLLDKMVAAMGFVRDAVYICNVVKCRPPGNRTPLPEEGRACSSFLHGQLEAVQPRVIVALGRCATENLGLVGAGGGWRGRWGWFRGVDVMPTYHPAFLLRSPEFKRPVWEDLQKVMGRLKEPR